MFMWHLNAFFMLSPPSPYNASCKKYQSIVSHMWFLLVKILALVSDWYFYSWSICSEISMNMRHVIDESLAWGWWRWGNLYLISQIIKLDKYAPIRTYKFVHIKKWSRLEYLIISNFLTTCQKTKLRFYIICNGHTPISLISLINEFGELMVPFTKLIFLKFRPTYFLISQ